MMTSLELMRALLATALAGSAAMAVVLALRGMVRRRLGASAAYLLWLAVPVALLAVLLPAPHMAVPPMTAIGTAMSNAATRTATGMSPVLPWSALLGATWLVGALATAAWLLRQQHRFARGLGRLRRRDDGLWQAQATTGLPAIIGLLPPRIVLPVDFEQRYTAQERRLVLLHERVHLRRGDIVVNALLAAMQCLYWFNPLVPLAVRRCREDQEFSCDERVIAGGGARRSYGNAMLKTGLVSSSLPVGCPWQGEHPLKERIAMLKHPVPGKKQWLAMVLLSAGLSSGLGLAAWAAQPLALPQVAAGAGAGSTAMQPATGETPDAPARMPGFAAMTPPRYPPSMHTGQVLLKVEVAADGTATRVTVDRSSGHDDLDEAAMAAARGWTFVPAYRNGSAVAGEVSVPVRFEMDAPSPGTGDAS